MVAFFAGTEALFPAGFLGQAGLGEESVDTPVGDLTHRLGQLAVGTQEPAKLWHRPARPLFDQFKDLLPHSPVSNSGRRGASRLVEQQSLSSLLSVSAQVVANRPLAYPVLLDVVAANLPPPKIGKAGVTSLSGWQV